MSEVNVVREIEQQYQAALERFKASSGHTVVAALDVCKAIYDAGCRLDKKQLRAFGKKFGLASAVRKRHGLIGREYDRLRPLAEHLPANVRALYLLARLPAETLDAKIQEKVVHPLMTAGEARVLMTGVPNAKSTPCRGLGKKAAPCHVVIDIVDDAAFGVAPARRFLLKLMEFLKTQHEEWSSVDPAFQMSATLTSKLAAAAARGKTAA